MERRHKEGANQVSRPVPPQQLLRACVHAPTVAACMLRHRSAVIISKFKFSNVQPCMIAARALRAAIL